MALNFPNNPAINQIYHSDNSVWKYDGTIWSPINATYEQTIRLSDESTVIPIKIAVVSVLPEIRDDSTLYFVTAL